MIEKKEVEDMEKFMTILMDVKVSLAEQNGKLDSLLDIKKKVDATYDKAHEANNRSKENAKDIKEIREDLKECASKEELVDIRNALKDRASKQDINKRDWIRNGIAIVAIAVSVVSFLMP